MSSRKEENEESSGFGWFGLGVATAIGAGIGVFLASGSSATEGPQCNVSSGTRTGASRQNSEAYRNRQPTCEPCGICLDNILVVVRLPCGHRFHKDCVKKWISEMRTCPICRQPASLTQLKYSA